MELLAFVHSSVNYEDPTPDPELTLDIKVPSSAGVALAGVALAVAAVSASPSKASAATPAIAQGSSGDAVTNVQKALGIEADGQFGPITAAAVMDFQIRQGLKQVDGVVGKETATALGLDEKYQPTYFGFSGYVDTCSGCGLNVRSGPGINYRRIGGLPDGTYVETFGPVVERYYSWQRIGHNAWIATDYVEPSYYEPRGYYHNDCYDPCDHYYEPRSYYYDDCYDPCDHYYKPRSYYYDDCYDPCDHYYKPRSYYYDDCYDPCDHYYEPRRWAPCDHYYEPRSYYYDDCYDPCDRYYEPSGYYYDDCGCY
jgi:uncharacterized protein YraI